MEIILGEIEKSCEQVSVGIIQVSVITAVAVGAHGEFTSALLA